MPLSLKDVGTKMKAIGKARTTADADSKKNKEKLEAYNQKVNRINELKSTVIPFQIVGLVIAILFGGYYLSCMGLYVTEPEVTEARLSHANFTVRNETGIPKADPGFIAEQLLQQDIMILTQCLRMGPINTTGWPNDLKTEVNKWAYKNTTMTMQDFVDWTSSNNYFPHYRKEYPGDCLQRWQARVDFFEDEKLKAFTEAERTLKESNDAGTQEHNRWHKCSAWVTLVAFFLYLGWTYGGVYFLDASLDKLHADHVHLTA